MLQIYSNICFTKAEQVEKILREDKKEEGLKVDLQKQERTRKEIEEKRLKRQKEEREEEKRAKQQREDNTIKAIKEKKKIQEQSEEKNDEKLKRQNISKEKTGAKTVEANKLAIKQKEQANGKQKEELKKVSPLAVSTSVDKVSCEANSEKLTKSSLKDLPPRSPQHQNTEQEKAQERLQNHDKEKTRIKSPPGLSLPPQVFQKTKSTSAVPIPSSAWDIPSPKKQPRSQSPQEGSTLDSDNSQSSSPAWDDEHTPSIPSSWGLPVASPKKDAPDDLGKP